MSAAIKAVLNAHAVEDYSDEYEDASLLCGCGFVARGSDLYDAGDSHREHLATVLTTVTPPAKTIPVSDSTPEAGMPP